MDASFVFNSALMGVGLAMDAFSVSLANGLAAPRARIGASCRTAGVFAFFQALMPMLGWACVHTAVTHFSQIQRFVPYAALVLLVFIGGKMLYEGIRGGEEQKGSTGFGALLLQGVATSIDALSVGLTIDEYNFSSALVCALIIAAVTFAICFAGVEIGKKAGTKLAGKASVLGGCILIAIGIEIFVKGVFF